MKLSTVSDDDAIQNQLHSAISEALPGAEVTVEAHQPGHFSISVVSKEFSGKTRLASQRLVYGAIGHLMRGERAPVHAIDRLQTSPD